MSAAVGGLGMLRRNVIANRSVIWHLRRLWGSLNIRKSGQLKGAIFDGAEPGYLEIKCGSSLWTPSYQLRLQMYKATVEGKSFTIQTSRPINSEFEDRLDFWGANVTPSK